MRSGTWLISEHRRGSSTVELAVLLPIYVMVFFGVFYLGRVALLQERSHEANRLAAALPGPQEEAPGARGEVGTVVFASLPGDLDLVEHIEPWPPQKQLEGILPPPSPPGPPQKIKVQRVKGTRKEQVTITRRRQVGKKLKSVTGRIYIDPSGNEILQPRLEWEYEWEEWQEVVERDVPEYEEVEVEYRPPPAPKRLFDADLCGKLLKDWLARSETDSSYHYKPSYLSLRHVGIPPVTPSAAHKGLSRTDTSREVRSPSGDTLAPRHLSLLPDTEVPETGFPPGPIVPKPFFTPN